MISQAEEGSPGRIPDLYLLSKRYGNDCSGKAVKEMGTLWQSVRSWWEACLDRLSKANKESFGGGKMDCCGLGKESEAGKRH